jgi:trimeric autotransporter adhesin
MWRRSPGSRHGSRVARGRTGALLSFAGIAGGMILLGTGAAFAYWQTTDSSHAAAAVAGTLAAPTGGAQHGTATATSIPISWTAPVGYSPTSYTVLRCAGSSCTPGAAVAVGGCGGSVMGTSCTDTDPGLVAGATYSYAIEARLDSWTSHPSGAFQGTAAANAELSFTTQPSLHQNIQATGTGSFPVAVAVQDANGNTDTNDSSDTVTLAIGTNPSIGVLTCSGGLTATVSSGVASFTGCAITKAGTGYTLTASSLTSPSLAAPTNANAFNITAGTAARLAFTTQPSANQNIQATGTGSFPVAVAVQDANGNVEAGDNTDTVTLAIGTNPSSGVLTCSGGLTVTVSSGVASYTGCAISKTGTGYKLTASSLTSPTLTAPTNANAFNITVGSASQLTFTAQPSAGQNIQAAGTGSFSVAVSVEDQNGNVVTSDSGRSVTLSLGTSPTAGSVLSCTDPGGLTVTDASGVASYTGCSITLVGSGYKLTASSTSLTAPANANAFNITAGTATRLAFTTQPSAGQNIQAAGTGSFPVAVAVQDANGNVETADSGTVVTLALGTNPGGGVLSCTNAGDLTVTDVSGVASFTGCAITKTGTGYKLTASSSPSFTAPANANPFNIIAGNAAGLTFTNVTTALGSSGTTCTGAVGSASYDCTINGALGSLVFYDAYVTLIDQNGNAVTAGSAISVSLSTTAGLLSPTSVTIPSGSSTSSTSFGVTLSLGTTTASASVNSTTVFAKLTP